MFELSQTWSIQQAHVEPKRRDMTARNFWTWSAPAQPRTHSSPIRPAMSFPDAGAKFLHAFRELMVMCLLEFDEGQPFVSLVRGNGRGQ